MVRSKNIYSKIDFGLGDEEINTRKELPIYVETQGITNIEEVTKPNLISI